MGRKGKGDKVQIVTQKSGVRVVMAGGSIKTNLGAEGAQEPERRIDSGSTYEPPPETLTPQLATKMRRSAPGFSPRWVKRRS